MKDLDEYNDERYKLLRGIGDNLPRKNGIACPNCGEELLDSRPGETLASDPPKKSVHCERCEYNGYRVL